MKLIFLFFALIILSTFNTLYAIPSICSDRIKLDQFGYRPNDQKIAVISSPQKGFNALLPEDLKVGKVYQVRDWFTDKVIFTAESKIWNSGAIHDQSGDKCWWVDFSAFTKQGSYYLFDTERGFCSYRFEINNNVYDEVLVHAMRMFLYQRCNYNKTTKYYGPGFEDKPSHMGKNQDKYCIAAWDSIGTEPKRDLTGGWFDAGDFNKYTSFAFWPLQDLFLSYQENKKIWRDDYNIPESGNGVPDILDEAKYELDWLLKMQNKDGSLSSKVAVSAYQSMSPPSADTNTRRYGKPSTNASLTGAMAFSLGSIEYKAFAPTKAYASKLLEAAKKAWAWAIANPNNRFKNEGFSSANPDRDNSYGGGFPPDYSKFNFLVAAVYLYAATGDAQYQKYFDENFAEAHMISGEAFLIYENYVYQAFAYYTSLKGATPSVVDKIKLAYTNYLDNTDDKIPAYLSNKDAYRAYIKDQYYEWGSTWRHMMTANFYTDAFWYGLHTNKAQHTLYQNAAASILHYMHGTNPIGIVYMSNMNKFGAEKSITQFYHNWYMEGSKWDQVGVSEVGPPSGYFGSGPNAKYTVNMFPKGEPPQKAFKDWNTAWNGANNESAYEITEAGIYYQAAYIRVLSKFCNGSKGFKKWW
jgi:endoglucanase